VARNPANPSFNHFLFEALASLLRTSVAPRPEVAAQFEAAVMPHAAAIIQNDVLEFQPYLYQVLAAYLDARAPFAGAVRSMLPALLAPLQWQRRGGVPALASLMCAFLERGGAPALLADGALPPLLAAWRGVLAVKGQEAHAFALLDALFLHLPADALAPQLRPLLETTLGAVQALKAFRVAAMFIHSVGLLCGAHGPAGFVAALAAIAPGLLHQITDAVIAPMAGRVAGATHRREAAVGLTRLLCEAPAAFLSDAAGQAAWAKLLQAVAELAEGGAAAAPAGAVSRAAQLGGAAAFLEDEDLPEEAAEGPPAEYAASYNRLVYATVPVTYAFPALPAPPAFFSQSLAALVRQAPQVLPVVQGAGATVARLTAGAF
jgi:exportin-2 (importin alpha re-exporter)